MTTRGKIGVAAALTLALAGAWILWPRDRTPPPRPAGEEVAELPEAMQAELPEVANADAARAEALQREAVAAPEREDSTGTLVVHARHGDDRTPAAGILLSVTRPGSDPRIEGQRRRTDENGTARFPTLRPGQIRVAHNNGFGKRDEISAGQTTEIDYDLDVGLTVTGVVVDTSDLPVAGALVEVTMMARSDAYPEVVATTGADGRFTARASPTACMFGARAAGYTASPLRFLLGQHGNTADVKLVLGEDGGSVEGFVFDAGGAPVAGAVVILGDGELSGIPGRDHAPPFPALARSDAEGRFHAVGIPTGEQPVQVRGVDHAPWQGTCEIEAGRTVTLDVTLDPGATIRGTVRNAEGAPVDRAEVEIGSWDDLAHYRTLTESDGSFSLDGLPAGDIEVTAEHDDFGKAVQTVQTEAGATAACDLQLSRGLELVGRVVDEDGQPVAEVLIECFAERDRSWSAFVRTDAQGRFAAANCPEQGTITVTVRGLGIAELRRTGIDPMAGELVLQVRRAEPRSVRIVGTVVGPDGRPVSNAMVSASLQGARSSTGIEATDDSGRFELGPVSPGAWRVTARSTEHPEFLSEVRELSADATWDLGTITLPLGGAAVLRGIGEALSRASFYVHDADGTRSWSIQEVGGELRSGALAPGDYRLAVFGEGTAAQDLPFAIRPGEETVVDVQLQPGVSQPFEIALPPDFPVPDSVVLRVHRAGEFVGRTWTAVRRGEPVIAETWLSPGDYSFTATAGELRGAGTFTVGSVAGAPVRVQLH